MVNFGKFSVQKPPTSVEELSVLSLDAAIELDRFSNGKGINKDVIRNLVDKLRLQKEGAETADVLQSLVDPNTIDIYNRAVSHLTEETPNTVDDLAKQVSKFVGGFKREIDALANDEVVMMRDFCLALHRELLAELYDRNNDQAADVT